MPRTRRYIFNTLTAASLLLMLGVGLDTYIAELPNTDDYQARAPLRHRGDPDDDAASALEDMDY